MAGKQGDSLGGRGIKRSLNRRILRNTTLNILILVVICCVIMALSLQSLANNILLDSLQPMARQSAKTVEANIHMLADRMMTIAGDPRMSTVAAADPEGAGAPRPDAVATAANRMAVLEEAAEIYEFHTVALYGLDGRLLQGIDGAPERLDGDFFTLLKETDNLTTDSTTVYQGKLGVTMGMPVKEDGETAFYVMGIYKYDTLNDVISSINIGRSGMAFMANREGIVTGHPDQGLVLSGSTLAQLSGGSGKAVERVATGETGATEFSIDGRKMLVAFSPIRGTQWSLVIQIPKSDYNHFINWAMAVSVMATLVGLAVSILLILRFARSISRPVKRVTDRMVALSGGDLHTEVLPVDTGDELEVMTQTLDATLESMNRYISDIQQVLTNVAGGDLRTDPQVDYKGDFVLIRASLCTITQSMNETLLGFRAAADRLTAKSAEAAKSDTNMVNNTKAIIQTGVELTADTAGSLRAISDVSDQINTISDQLAAAVQGQETALAVMEERIAAISGIADRNLQNAGETELSSSSLAKEAESLQAQVRKFILKEKCGT